MVHIPAKFQENRSMRFRVGAKTKHDGQTAGWGGGGGVAISPGPGPSGKVNRLDYQLMPSLGLQTLEWADRVHPDAARFVGYEGLLFYPDLPRVN